MTRPSKSWSARTKLVHGGTRRSQYNEVSEAMFLTQGFVYESAEQAEARFLKSGPDEFIYARYGNPTVRMFEDRLALLLGYEDCFACTSGMAAVSGALTALLKAGDHVVSSRALFGSCLYVLQDVLGRFGVEITLVDGRDNTAWDAAIRDDTRLVFFESISNPTLEIVDTRHVVKAAHRVGALVLVDDAMATPVFSYASACGADIAIISTTKHVDGQGRMLDGAICGTRDLIRGPIETYMKHTGGAMNPFTAWTHLKSLETIDLRKFGIGKHLNVDDTPAGGGAGMVLRPDVVAAALDEAAIGTPDDRAEWPIIYLSPRGRPLDQAMARRWSKARGMTLICGRFEGVDERVLHQYRVEEVALGDFVLTGGEIAAQALLDATVRLIPRVLGNQTSTEEESFSDGLLEFPQFTKPAVWQGLAIPEVLQSGHHGKIAFWRRAMAERLTKERRPDLWRAYCAKHGRDPVED